MNYYRPPERGRHWGEDESDDGTPSKSPQAPRANKNYGYAGHLATLSPGGDDDREDLFNR